MGWVQAPEISYLNWFLYCSTALQKGWTRRYFIGRFMCSTNLNIHFCRCRGVSSNLFMLLPKPCLPSLRTNVTYRAEKHPEFSLLLRLGQVRSWISGAPCCCSSYSPSTWIWGIVWSSPFKDFLEPCWLTWALTAKMQSIHFFWKDQHWGLDYWTGWLSIKPAYLDRLIKKINTALPRWNLFDLNRPEYPAKPAQLRAKPRNVMFLNKILWFLLGGGAYAHSLTIGESTTLSKWLPLCNNGVTRMADAKAICFLNIWIDAWPLWFQKFRRPNFGKAVNRKAQLSGRKRVRNSWAGWVLSLSLCLGLQIG